MTRREGNRFDGTLAGTNFRLVRDGEGAYRRVTERSAVPFQESQETRGQFVSRSDVRGVFQTDWSEGAFWNKPLLSSQSMGSYHTSYLMDAHSEPGNIFPSPPPALYTPDVDLSTEDTRLVQVSTDEIYYSQDGGANGELVLYNGSTFANLTNDFSPVSLGDEFVGLCYDAENATIFALFEDGKVHYVTPDSAGDLVATFDALATYAGSNIFMHFGELMVYNGDKLIQVVDPLGTPSNLTIYDDGLGPDAATERATPSTRVVGNYSMRLAVSSAEGIWIVKNTVQEGLPAPMIVRVDRTNEGEYIGVPVASLMPGTIVLDIAFHLGGLLLTCATEMTPLFEGSGPFQIVVYQYTPESGLSTIGSPLGPRPADTPYKLLAVNQGLVFLGAYDRIWVYDAGRGGLHPFTELDPTGSIGVYNSMAFTTDSSGNHIYQFTHVGEEDEVMRVRDADIGADGAYLESNYFDFNLPAEPKTITHATLMTDGLAATEEYIVTVEVDDAGSWSTVATWDSDDDNTQRKTLATPLTGHRFRYKIEYNLTSGTSLANPARIKGIQFYAIQGELVTRWMLQMDASEFMNVENQPVDPDTVIDAMETLSRDETVVSFVDEYRETAVTSNVKVEQVSIDKQSPSEGVVTVVLTEVEA